MITYVLTPRPATRSKTAVKRVLGVAEVLEGILIHLPPEDVLVLQRVSTVWQAMIKGSLMLQRALYYTSTEANYVETGSSGDRVYLSSQAFRSSAQQLVHAFTHEQGVFNPVLDRLFDAQHPAPGMLTGIITSKVLQDLRTAIKPSWTRMYLTQPPASRMKVQRFHDCNRKRSDGKRKRRGTGFVVVSFRRINTIEISRANGITIDNFVEEVVRDGALGSEVDLHFTWETTRAQMA